MLRSFRLRLTLALILSILAGSVAFAAFLLPTGRSDPRLQIRILVASLLLALLASGLAVWSGIRIRTALGGLTDAARRLAGGNLRPLAIPRSSSEIAELARAINRLSDRLRGENLALDSEQEKLAALLQQMTSGVLMLDSQGRIALLNQAVRAMFDLPAGDYRGHSLAETLRQHQIVELWDRARQGQETLSASLDIPRRGLSLLALATPLGGPLAGFTLVQLQNQTRLRYLETVRQDFISNLSHELRTPLASLKALTETLLDGALDDPPAARRFLERIETEVDSLALMVQELLELARIESGRVPLTLQPCDPCHLIRTAVERLKLQAERTGLNVEIECAERLPAVPADPPRMEQVLMNLLHNAIKFTPTGGQIRVSAGQRDDKPGVILFQVRDTGAGIPADALERIFERFYKADRARASGGTGLGLAIARHLVEAHGGKIWAESIEGQGSTFSLTLPVP